MKHIEKTVATLFLFLAMALVLPAMSPMEKEAKGTVQKEISRIMKGASSFAEPLSRTSEFLADLRSVLQKFPELGVPKPVQLEGKTAKILIPLNLDQKTVGGFIQVSPDGRTILSWFAWDKGLTPLFSLPRDTWEKASSVNDIPELSELIPIKQDYTAGIPVEVSDLDEYYIIDHLDAIPSKTQEERKAFTGRESLSGALGRRTGSSKCISYAVSMALDWWKNLLGMPLGTYVSFVNGALEYGTNPRLLEALYYSVPKSPYAWVLFTGKDRVTGEKIAYSPKHFAYVVSSIPLPREVRDPLKPGITYPFPEKGFGTDKPFFAVFDHHDGDVKTIRDGLYKYGILFSQHTMRLMHDKLSTPLGVHGVNIVGTGKLKGKDVVLYYETFGKNHRDYLEDSFYGPRLRAFPVQFFYQGLAFPHHLYVQVTPGKDTITLKFTDSTGKPQAPDALEAELDGNNVGVSPAALVKISGGSPENKVLKIRYAKKYFYAPEEDGSYERTYFFGKNGIIETREYEKILVSMKKYKQGLVAKILHKPENFYDYLVSREEKLRNDLVVEVKRHLGERDLVLRLKKAILENDLLKKSDFGRECETLFRFADTQKP